MIEALVIVLSCWIVAAVLTALFVWIATGR